MFELALYHAQLTTIYTGHEVTRNEDWEPLRMVALVTCSK